jgi:hypothetical protein
LKGYKLRITTSKKPEYFAFWVKVLSSGLYIEDTGENREGV